jgi:hypothetical protein
LDTDDRLGACQTQHQPGIILLQQRDLGSEWVGVGDFWATLGRRQRTESASIALATPVAQG